MQDAVFALQSPILLASFVAKCEASNIHIYCLKTDCEIRGIDCPNSPVRCIDDEQWLELVINFDKQVAF
jgi:sulfur relay protein TusB/DsrH